MPKVTPCNSSACRESSHAQASVAGQDHGGSSGHWTLSRRAPPLCGEHPIRLGSPRSDGTTRSISNTLLASVPAWRIDGVIGSMARAWTVVSVRPALRALQLAPPSVLLNTPLAGSPCCASRSTPAAIPVAATLQGEIPDDATAAALIRDDRQLRGRAFDRWQLRLRRIGDHHPFQHDRLAGNDEVFLVRPSKRALPKECLNTARARQPSAVSRFEPLC